MSMNEWLCVFFWVGVCVFLRIHMYSSWQTRPPDRPLLIFSPTSVVRTSGWKLVRLMCPNDSRAYFLRLIQVLSNLRYPCTWGRRHVAERLHRQYVSQVSCRCSPARPRVLLPRFTLSESETEAICHSPCSASIVAVPYLLGVGDRFCTLKAGVGWKVGVGRTCGWMEEGKKPRDSFHGRDRCAGTQERIKRFPFSFFCSFYYTCGAVTPC